MRTNEVQNKIYEVKKIEVKIERKYLKYDSNSRPRACPTCALTTELSDRMMRCA